MKLIQIAREVETKWLVSCNMFHRYKCFNMFKRRETLKWKIQDDFRTFIVFSAYSVCS